MCCNGTHFCGKIGSDLIPNGLQGKYAAKKLPGFRQSGGQIRENFLYRGASPVDISRGRAPYTDKLLASAGIRFVLDLADSEEDMEKYMAGESFDSPYAAGLNRDHRIVLLNMTSFYTSEEYKQKVAAGMRAMLN